MTNERSFTCYLAGTESLLVQCAEILLANGHRILGVISSDPATRKWTTEKGLRALDLDASLHGGPRGRAVRLLLQHHQPSRAAEGRLSRCRGEWRSTSTTALCRVTRVCTRRHGRCSPAKPNTRLRGTASRPPASTKATSCLQEPVAIGEGETALTLNAKCYEAGMASFAVLVERLAADTVDQRPQDLHVERTSVW